MAKTIIEWNGKKYQVVKARDKTCTGCAFFLRNEYKCTYPFFPEAPCADYDDDFKHFSFYILKEIKNGTKK